MENIEMNTQQFTTTLTKVGNKAIIPIPFDPDAVWGTKQRHHITGTVNAMPVRGALSKSDAGYSLSLGAAWCRGAALEVGGVTVTVVLAPEGPQFTDLAPDIAAALDADPDARAFFEALATFYRKGYLRWIDGARRPEARATRIAEMIDLLKAGKRQR
jgi:hypothetical protein